MAAAGKRKSNDIPLYRDTHRTWPDIWDLWQYHHPVDIEAAERASTTLSRKSPNRFVTGQNASPILGRFGDALDSLFVE